MTKRLVVCLDGTWNTPDDEGRATNVVKIMRALRPADDNGVAQVAFYDKGVGTGGFIDRIRGGAFGHGLGENVRDGYRFLGNNYQPGDEIYLFGFSRGAFTARSLAGLIGACGLLTKSTLGRLMEAWTYYRTSPKQRSADMLEKLLEWAHQDVPIACIGVWDTVGALGVPVERLKFFNRGKYQFHDTTLGRSVKVALHAVAIDERRGPFGPTLWQTPVPDAKQIVEQVWFPGVHSNIGGGYKDSGLSDLALDWMIRRVAAHTPLAFDDAYVAEFVEGDAMATLYESRSALYTASKWLPFERVIGGHDGWVRRFLSRTNRPEPGETFVNEKIHQSAVDRFNKSAPVHDGKTKDQTYKPENLDAALKAATLPIVT